MQPQLVSLGQATWRSSSGYLAYEMAGHRLTPKHSCSYPTFLTNATSTATIQDKSQVGTAKSLGRHQIKLMKITLKKEAIVRMFPCDKALDDFALGGVVHSWGTQFDMEIHMHAI